MTKETKMVVKSTEKKQPQVEIYEDIFAIVEIQGNYGIGIAGKMVVNRPFATKEEAKAYIDSKPWELIINATCLIYDLGKEATAKATK